MWDKKISIRLLSSWTSWHLFSMKLLLIKFFLLLIKNYWKLVYVCMHAPIPQPLQFVFCRQCKAAYHEGPCQPVQQTALAPAQQNEQAQQQPNPANIQRAGWIQANERFIQDNTKPCPRCKAPIEKNGQFVCVVSHNYCKVRKFLPGENLYLLRFIAPCCHGQSFIHIINVTLW